MTKIDRLLETIEKLQVRQETNIFQPGMFVSQRSHRSLPYYREDNNIFFPASIAFLLLKYKEQLDVPQQARVQRIVDGIRKNYPQYESRSNKALYNFYQTNPPRQYPNGRVLSKFNHFILADDSDDTVMITMTQENVSAERIQEIRENLVKFSNLQQKKIKGLSAKYSSLPFYATWFGSGRMPIEIELCILCNILYFTFHYGLELNEQDKASLEFIRIALETEDIVHNSFQISGQYPNTSVIVYHIARLCSAMKEPSEYIDLKKLTSILHRQRTQSTSLLEKILLATSLMQLGQEAEPVGWEADKAALQKAFDSFPFFIAPILSGTTNNALNQLKKNGLFHILFSCEAFYHTLLLEYELLQKKANAKVLTH